MYYPSSENKGADQLRCYREADLRLCFRLCRLLVSPCGGSNKTCSISLYFLFCVLTTTFQSYWDRSTTFYALTSTIGVNVSCSCVIEFRYIAHLYSLALQASFYSDVVECLLRTWFDPCQGRKNFSSPVTFGTQRKSML